MQKLNQLFTNATPIAPKAIKLLDGALTLYKRPQSHLWQCRFKLSNDKWHSASTGADDLLEARQNAIVLYETVRIKIDAGMALTEKTFGQLAIEEMANMRRIASGKRGERNFKDYLFIWQKYLIPFFGKYKVGDITQELVADFEDWRIAQMGRNAKLITKKHHALAYNRVIALAKEQGQIAQNRVIPALNITGERSQARPAFTQEELEQLYAYFPIWQRNVHHRHPGEVRVLCAAYIKFLVNTGIRHSTESLPLRWKHLQWHYIADKRYLRIWVSGKTGQRYLIARNMVIETLEELMQWQKRPYVNLDEIIDAKLDKLIFTLPSGEMPHLLENIFRHLMIKSGLLKNGAGQNRTLYSLRHTYATQALASGVDIHTLARQMGTSVLMIERHYSKITPEMNAEKLA